MPPAPRHSVTLARMPDGAEQPLFPDASVVLSGTDSPWRGLSVERVHLSLETPEHEHGDHFLTLHLGAPALLEWKQGARHRRARTGPGEFTLIGAHVPHLVRYEGAEVLAVSLAPSVVEAVAAELPGRHGGPVEFAAQNAVYDRQVERMGQLLRTEMEQGYPTGRLFGDSLGQALAAYLLRHYGASAPIPPIPTGALSPAQLRRAQDYVAANLSGDVTLAGMAEAAGLSPYHFARRFKASTGRSPHAFLTEQRVERATELLRRGDLPIAEVAAAVGFAHQSHLTRHFKRLVGVTPARFRAQT